MKSALIAAMLLTAVPVFSETISPGEAGRHVGEQATVCGTIAGEHTASSSRGKPTFINLDRPYPNQVFTVLIWGDDQMRVGSVPRSGQMCVTGTITSYRGVPEVVLHDSRNWFVPR